MSDTCTNETVRTTQGSLSATEVLQVLDDGGRVVIDLGGFEGAVQATIREKAGTYYCDTATKLLTHETKEGLTRCLEQYRLVETGDKPPVTA